MVRSFRQARAPRVSKLLLTPAEGSEKYWIFPENVYGERFFSRPANGKTGRLRGSRKVTVQTRLIRVNASIRFVFIEISLCGWREGNPPSPLHPFAVLRRSLTIPDTERTATAEGSSTTEGRRDLPIESFSVAAGA